MKATASALVVAAALLSAACGEGRAIFIVDVLSFIQPSGKDTIHYNLPTVVAFSADSFITPQKVSLPPGLGKSSVDSVQVTAAAVIENTTVTGSIQFQVYFSKDSADRIEKLKTMGITFTNEQKNAAGKIANAAFTAPDGQMFFVFEE